MNVPAKPSALLVGAVAVSGTLFSLLMGWVALGQSGISEAQTELKAQQAVFIANQKAIEAKLDLRIKHLESGYEEHENSIQNIWPRIRAHGSNILLLEEEIEDHHNEADIHLKEPERF